jgi:hypothetical protein
MFMAWAFLVNRSRIGRGGGERDRCVGRDWPRDPHRVSLEKGVFHHHDRIRPAWHAAAGRDRCGVPRLDRQTRYHTGGDFLGVDGETSRAFL